MLFDLLDEYGPLWYIEEHHDQAKAALGCNDSAVGQNELASTASGASVVAVRFLQKPTPMTHNDLSAQEILNALHSHVAVLDRDGNITHVNEAWVRFSEERGALPSSTGVGVNYFAVCGARGATAEVEEILAGIRAVISEAIPQFRTEYTCNTPKETYWYELRTK